MSRADIMAGRAWVSLGVKDNLTKGLKQAQANLQSFGSGIMGIGATVTAAGASVVGGLAGAVTYFAGVGDALDKMSLRTGMSVGALSELGFAAEQSGASMEEVENAAKRMQKNLGGIGPESVKTKEALAEMGLSLEAIQSMSPDEQFQTIAESIGDIEDPSKRAASAMAVFGEGGRKLLPMMKDIRALRAEAKELGLSPSPESVKAAASITDAINRVRRVIGATIYEIGAAVAPMAQQALDSFLVIVKGVRKFIAENHALIVTVAKIAIGVAAVGTAITAIGAVFVGAGAAIGGLLTVMSAVGAAFGFVASVVGAILSPMGLLVAAVGAGAYAWVRFTASGKAFAEFVSSTFGGILTTVRDTVGGIVAAVQSGDLALAGQIAMTGLRLVMTQGLEAIHAMFGETLGAIASKLLSGDISGAFATLGSTLLDSWAQITAGLVQLFTGAADAVMAKWQQTVNAISDYILESASEGGAMGWALEQISGVNMKEEAERGRRIEAQRRARGMTPDTGDGIVRSDQFQHAGLAAMKDAVAAAGQAANDGMKSITDATGAALEEKTAGSGAAASSQVAMLQAELDALRQRAAANVAAVATGGSSSGATGDAEGEGEEPGASTTKSGKASAAMFNFMGLSQTAAGGQLKAAIETKKAIQDLAKQQKEESTQMLAAMRSGGGLRFT
ncbi:MAG: phage tail tape measure protein [Planctomycetaceae bacterium]|nr:phage tail tape measure protein [Planctomycetaceae bacterium]